MRGARGEKTRRFAPLMAAAILFAACAPAAHTNATRAVVVERLFFGRNAHGAEVVSDAAWNVFLEEVVTPRFPEGFATWHARGQWRRGDGEVEREASFVLELVHAADAAAEAKVAAIIAEYKLRFGQEAVLRLVMPGRAGF